MRSKALRASTVDRLKREKFQTARPCTSPRSMRVSASFQSGRELSPPEASSSSYQSTTVKPSRSASAWMAFRCSFGLMNESPERPPTGG